MHDDRKASLSLGLADGGRLLTRCFAGCDQRAVFEAVRDRARELGLLPVPARKSSAKPAETAAPAPRPKAADAASAGAKATKRRRTWPAYHARTGEHVADHIREDLPAGGKRVWWSRRGVRTSELALYRFGKLAERPDLPAVICEGEVATDALATVEAELGIVAVGTVTGASGTPCDAALEPLRGRTTLLWPDGDDPGRAHMQRIARRLAELGVEDVRVVNWPAAPPKGDAADAVADGVNIGALLANARPWAPAEDEDGATAADVTPVEAETIPGGPPGAEHFTDLGNAKRLARLRGEDVRYVPQWGRWLVWDGTRWALDMRGRVHALAEDLVRDLLEQGGRTLKQAAAERDPERRRRLEEQGETCLAWARKCEATQRIEAALSLLRFRPGIAAAPEDFDRDPWLLNCSNGTVDLRTGELRPHRRSDMLTKSTGVPYVPGAKASRFAEFLRRVMDGNEALVSYLQRFAGMSACGVIREHVLAVLYGTGHNGKSTFLERLRNALGDYACSAAPELLLANKNDRHPTEFADLFGRRFVYAFETEDGKRFAEAVVKRLTGGDTIKARRMREDFWEFKPTHTLWLGTNHKPVVRGTDFAIWRRLRLIPFTVTIPPEERDPALPEKLDEELPGILKWIIEGALAWQREGLADPPEVLAATDSYRAEMDVLANFVEDCCVIATSAKAPARDLYATYLKWCESNGERPLAQRTFGMRLAERGFQTVKSTGGRKAWQGIGLLEPDADPASGRPAASGSSGPSGPGFGDNREEIRAYIGLTRESGPLGPLSPLGGSGRGNDADTRKALNGNGNRADDALVTRVADLLVAGKLGDAERELATAGAFPGPRTLREIAAMGDAGMIRIELAALLGGGA